MHYIIIVKVHRVFPSSCMYPASSREFQFHWDNTRDSKTIVTSLMQDGTYPSRNFATLGLSELQPPFTEDYIKYFLNNLILIRSTGQMSNFIHYNNILQSFVFLINSRCFLLSAINHKITILQLTLFFPKLQS